MTLLEAEVHISLREFLRHQGQPIWDHHLTMARLVSRALRLDRSALIQTGSTFSRYALSYLVPCLLSDRPILLVVPFNIQQKLIEEDIPYLQGWLNTNKAIATETQEVDFTTFKGLFLVSPDVWLGDRLDNRGGFPDDILTLIDQADYLEEWTKNHLTLTIYPDDWQQLQQEYSSSGNLIQEVKLFLEQSIFSRPNNPYQCCLLDNEERESLAYLCDTINHHPLLQGFAESFKDNNQLLWASINQDDKTFLINSSPLDVSDILSPHLDKSTMVLMGGFLDNQKMAPIYRKTIGLNQDILCLKFFPHRQNELINLYIRDRLPMPNTPEFHQVLIEEVKKLVFGCYESLKPITIIVDDVPAKAQVATFLAAEFGSQVKVENTTIDEDSILISGWKFWHQNQGKLPNPQLLIIATLPIPSLENPLVAAQVNYCKKQHKDWFRFYLLPTALTEIQRAVMPLRESQGIVALLDNRVNYRSYGNLILTALEPYAKLDYIDLNWLEDKINIY
ncbi:helicase C-terminal domain-containing protein [Crocosphaera sp.]|uniref:helicase C-terminal domain-containing protein n=1 Tax=Crocosphaera sp. TaxID=2729996 RepID=UPI00260E698F|nr:helicase C-terminal domain-containing protein [Crocosphaera sp.]MDJ0579239.1 ATP-dependent DNA helicase [Crocosphaera sp.]